ncbi:unnamed protein product [Cyclocybe aegerita]|uniref:Uncharacterized protein n=1 Tax=Cyclocybe aegerita TaxID=1973307 RepID=A0A8S0W4A7_CYCAE|nr:unnamed protein product [Cyclocybe aegerita]
MATSISITTSRTDQAAAASYLSETLDRLGCPHAYIGGFAWALLGNRRPTEMNVLIETKNLDMVALRSQLQELSKKFASAGIKLYFVKEPLGDLRGDELVRASKNNVLIETLSAGTLGLPNIAGPVYKVEYGSGISIEILHPGILILTKMKRWYHNLESTRPKTLVKNSSDRRDLDYLVSWLADNKMTIEFELYEGKSKDELLKFVRIYREQVGENELLMEALKTAVKPLDWDLL